VRYFLSLREPPPTRILLIESGARSLIEGLLPHLRTSWARDIPIDLVTCYGGVSAGFGPEAIVYRVTDYKSPDGHNELVRQLRTRDYSFVGVICSGEPVMTKWKWLIALRLPAKVFIVNENGDYFWINREHVKAIRQFSLIRLGLSGEGSMRTVGRLLIFPFSLLYLLMYAFAAHSGRMIRQLLHPTKL
jgi:hypothetical protein